MSVVIGSANLLGVNSSDVCSFYKQNWNKPIVLSSLPFYEWQFVNNPYNYGCDECCVAMDGSKIVGIMGLNAHDFYVDSCRKNGAELTTWMVNEKYHMSGVGPKMIDYLKNTYDVLIGMGITDMALPVYLRKGFKYIRSIPRYTKVINWESILPYSIVKPLARKVAKMQIGKMEYKVEKFNADVINNINSDFLRRNNSFSRSYKDIHWRLLSHPIFKYEIAIVRYKTSRCVVSYRIDKDIEAFTVMHGLDIFGDQKAYKCAIAYLEEVALKQNVDVVDFYATNSTLEASFKFMNWFSLLDDNFFKFPHLFHPIELRDPATTSLIYWSKNSVEDFFNVGKMHITKQDADFDRPTI